MKLVKDTKNLIQIDVLPYHKTAGARYSMINMEYQPEFDVNANPKILTLIFEANGIKYKVF